LFEYKQSLFKSSEAARGRGSLNTRLISKRWGCCRILERIEPDPLNEFLFFFKQANMLMNRLKASQGISPYRHRRENGEGNIRGMEFRES
jgi:hypothetical protein